jgi:hypothetical protein
MNEFSVQELIILKAAMQDRIALTERLINELGNTDSIANKILLDNYRCLHFKIVEFLQRRISGLG